MADSTGGKAAGWCCLGAFTNAFYYWDLHGYSGLFDHGAGQPLLNRANFAIEDLAINRMNLNGTGKKTIPQYMEERPAAGRPTYTEYFPDGGQIKKSNIPSGCGASCNYPPVLSADTGHTSFYPLYKDLLNRGQTVMLQLRGGEGTWWKNIFHVVTGAGWDNNVLYFADPNDTARGKDWGAVYMPGDTMVPATSATNAERAAFYSKATVGADGNTFVAGGAYPTSSIDRLFVLSAPEPAKTYKFTRIADTTTPVPTDPLQKFFHFDFPPAISGSTVAFQSRYNGEGIFRGSGGELTKIVKLGDTVPSSVNVFGSGFSKPAISGGNVAFQSAYAGGSGIFVGSGGSLTTIAKEGEQAPAGGTFATIFDSPSISGNMVAFKAGLSDNGVGVFRGSGGPSTLKKIAKTGDPAPFGLFTDFFASDPPSISGDQVAFHGRYRDESGSTGNGIFRGNGGQLTTIAESGEPAPSGSFESFRNPAISEMTVAFIGDYTGGSGVFVSSGGDVTPIALTGQPALGGTFLGFDGPAVSGTTVAFRGRSSGGTGIFVFSDGFLATVIKTGDPLFGSTVNGLASNTSFGASGIDAGGNGNLAFQYSLADGRRGVAMAMPTLAGDYNGDGIVSAIDYVLWRNNRGTQAEYDAWRANYGRTIAGSGSTLNNVETLPGVPEPTSLLLFAAATFVFFQHRGTQNHTAHEKERH